MRTHRMRLGIAGTLVATLFLSAGTIALAHPYTDTYVARWQDREIFSGERRVSWGFGNMPDQGTFAMTTSRQRIIEGSEIWDLGEDFRYWDTGTDDSLVGMPRVGCWDKHVFAGIIDGSGGTLAWTRMCRAGDRMTGFVINFDREEKWYNGTGSPASDQFDLIGVAAHEFGHASGWLNHWTSSSSTLCPWTSSRHVMCPSITDGVTWWRSLKTHDFHTFSSAYNNF